MLRHDGRSSGQMRPIRIVPNFTRNATGSVLVEFGETRVICTVCVEEGVPSFLRNSSPAQGWLTAEYSMLPGSTGSRTRRERPAPSGRSQEIQRLIGRSLRGVIDLKKATDLTFNIDCDVIQADGGTRTASITGAYVALKMAVDKLIRSGRLHENPLTDAVAAVSVGLRDGEVMVDLDYQEDSTADLDMNVVMTQGGKFLEIQGTAERAAFSRQEVSNILDAAEASLKPVFELLHEAADGHLVET
ncbi:MAG: ribonuclease PH [Proteobacteria bacterium]|nr:MAG: ribonuclease PH [Pseudomonadota bacterium]